MVKICLACGQRKPEGYIGLDIADIPEVEIVCNRLEFPWPLEDNSVDEVLCEHFLEHVPKEKRPGFANELYRVMKPGAKAVFVVPSYLSQRMYQDPTHEWPPIVPQSFLYWHLGWREDNKLTHGPYAEYKCNFLSECEMIGTPEWESRHQAAVDFALTHYWNSTIDMRVYLEKI